MYNCEMCGSPSPAGQPIIRRVVASRETDYPPREYKVKGREGKVRDPGGVGRETVKEAALCSDCAYALDLHPGTFKPFKRKPKPGALAIRKASPPRKPAGEPPAPERIQTLRIDPRA